MLRRIRIKNLAATSGGMESDVVRQLTASGVVDGGFLIIEKDKFNAIQSEINKLRLGDRVATIAKPIARMIDGILGTNIQNCEGCAERQERLNSMFQNKPKE